MTLLYATINKKVSPPAKGGETDLSKGIKTYSVVM